MTTERKRPPAKWYEDAFGKDYLDRYAHRDEDEARTAAALLRDTITLPAGGRAFDLCCGGGRHLPFIAELGLEVFGGDLSMPLLREARAIARRAHQDPDLVRLDMRYLPFPDGSFHLVTNFFTAFGYFESNDENRRVVAEVARVLNPGGWFLLDFLNADIVKRELAVASGWETMERDNGEIWRTRRGLSSDGLRAEKIEERFSDGPSATYRESVRLYTPAELKCLLTGEGFQVERLWGDYEGSPFNSATSTRCTILSVLNA